MRLVVDTNVLISAALTQASWPANTVRWIGRYGGLLKSEATEQELFVVLERPRVATKMAPFFVEDLRRIFVAAEHVVIKERIAVCRDPADRRKRRGRRHHYRRSGSSGTRYLSRNSDYHTGCVRPRARPIAALTRWALGLICGGGPDLDYASRRSAFCTSTYSHTGSHRDSRVSAIGY